MNHFNLATVLRRIGTVTLLVAGASFLFEGWHTLTSIDRYLSFLGFSVALAVIGFWCGKVFKEAKGARTFLGLATATMTVHFAQLGAALFTSLGQDDKVTTMLGTLPLSLLTVGGVLVTLPIAYVGFAALNRKNALALATSAAALNSLLLVPVREGPFATMLLIVSAVLFFLSDFRIFRKDAESSLPLGSTLEGTASRLLLLSSLAVMIGRTAMYPMTSLTAAALLFLTAGVMFFYLTSVPALRDHRTAFHVVSLPFFLGGCIELASASGFAQGMAEVWQLFFYSLPFSVMLHLLSHLMKPEVGRFFRGFVALGMLAVIGVHFFIVTSLSSLFVIVLGVIFIATALLNRERLPLYCGTISVAMGLFHHLMRSIHFWWQTPWLSLSGLGLIILLLAVYLEKNSEVVSVRYRALRTRLAQWE